MRAKVFITTAHEEVFINKKRHVKFIDEFEENLALKYLERSLEGIVECTTLDSGQWAMNKTEVVNRIKKEFKRVDQKFLGISSYVYHINETKALASQAKLQDKNTVVIAGGPGPTHFPEKYLASKNIDYVVLGEADATLPELMQKLISGKSTLDINGIAYKLNGSVITTNKRAPVDLDELKFPKREHLSYRVLFRGEKRVVPEFNILTSKGCYANCGFCGISTIQPKFRQRSNSSLIKEVTGVVDQFNIGNEFVLTLNDVNFMSDAQKVGDFISDLDRLGLKVHISGDSRIKDLIRGEKVIETYADRIANLTMGAESFSKPFLERWEKRHTPEDIAKALEIAKRLDIPYRLFMLGTDQETNSKEAIDSFKFMFNSEKVPSNVWKYFITHPTTPVRYGVNKAVQKKATKQRYTNKQRIYANTSWFDLDKFKHAFKIVDTTYLKKEIKQNPEYQNLETLAGYFFQVGCAYQTSFLSQRGKNEHHKLKFDPDKLKKGKFKQHLDQLLTNHTKNIKTASDEIINWFDQEVKKVVRKISDQAISSGHYNDKECARICSDLGQIVSKGRIAQRYSKKAIELDPKNLAYKFLYTYNRANISGKSLTSKIRRIFKGVEDFENITCIPSFISVLAPSFYWTEKEKAIRIVNEASKRVPASEALICLAGHHQRIREYDKAMQYVTEFIRMVPSSSTGLLITSELAHKIGNEELLKECYDTFISLGGSEYVKKLKQFKEFQANES